MPFLITVVRVSPLFQPTPISAAIQVAYPGPKVWKTVQDLPEDYARS